MDNAVIAVHPVAEESASNLSKNEKNVIILVNELLAKNVTANSNNQRHQEREEERKEKERHFPFFIAIISVIQGILFYCDGDSVALLALCYDPRRRHEIWRFLTIMLVHNTQFHLWRSLFLQMILGIPLEVMQNGGRVALIYLASVLGGTMFITVVSPKIYAFGASGAVYGLFFAHFSTFVLDGNTNNCNILWLCRLLVYFMLFVFDFGSKVYSHIVPQTNIAAEVGGAIFGFLVATLMLKSIENPPWKKIIKLICAVIMIVLVTVIIKINFENTNNYYPSLDDRDYQNSVKMHFYQNVKDGDIDIKTVCQGDPKCIQVLRYNYSKIENYLTDAQQNINNTSPIERKSFKQGLQEYVPNNGGIFVKHYFK